MSFDPSQPFEVVDSSGFDPSKPFEKVEQPTALEAGGHAFVNNLPLGGQAAALAKTATTDKGYSENLGDWNKQTDVDKATHPIAYDVGAVGGALAPLALGGVPEIAETVKAAPIASNAILGALNAAGNTDLTKNPEEALKQGAAGAVIGGTTAYGLGKLFPSPSTLESVANTTANRSLNLPSGTLVDMTPEERQALGSMARENGLVGLDKESALTKARELSDTFGKKIGAMAENTKGIGLDPVDHINAIKNLANKAEDFENSAFRDGKALARSYQAGAKEISNLPQNASWNDIQALKERAGKLAFKSTGEIKDQGIADTYFSLKDMLKGIAAKAQGVPGLPDEYKEALAGYTQLHPVITGLEKAVDADLRGGTAGMGFHPMRMIGSLPRSLRYPAGALATAMGHPILGAASVLPEVMNPAIQSKALSAAATALPGIKQGATQEMIDFLESKFGRKKTP